MFEFFTKKGEKNWAFKVFWKTKCALKFTYTLSID